MEKTHLPGAWPIDDGVLRQPRCRLTGFPMVLLACAMTACVTITAPMFWDRGNVRAMPQDAAILVLHSRTSSDMDRRGAVLVLSDVAVESITELATAAQAGDHAGKMAANYLERLRKELCR